MSATETLALATEQLREVLAEMTVRRDAYAAQAPDSGWSSTVAGFNGEIRMAELALLWLDAGSFDDIEARTKADYPAALTRLIERNERIVAEPDRYDNNVAGSAEFLRMLRQLATDRAKAAS